AAAAPYGCEKGSSPRSLSTSAGTRSDIGSRLAEPLERWDVVLGCGWRRCWFWRWGWWLGFGWFGCHAGVGAPVHFGGQVVIVGFGSAGGMRHGAGEPVEALGWLPRVGVPAGAGPRHMPGLGLFDTPPGLAQPVVRSAGGGEVRVGRGPALGMFGGVVGVASGRGHATRREDTGVVAHVQPAAEGGAGQPRGRVGVWWSTGFGG